MTRVFLAADVNIGDKFQLGTGKSIGQVDAYKSLGNFVSAILPTTFVVSGIILFVLIVFGGLMMVVNAGSGDAKKAEQGKNALTSGIIGMVLIFCAYWIIKLIEFITGITIF